MHPRAIAQTCMGLRRRFREFPSFCTLLLMFPSLLFGLSSHVIGPVNGLELLEGVDLDDVRVGALPDFDGIVFLPIDQRHLFPVAFLAARGGVHFGYVLGQLMAVRLVPVGDAHHLPYVVPFAADLLLDYHAVLHPEAPVVAPLLLNREEIGCIMVLPDDLRVGDQQVGLEDIGIGQHVPGDQGRADVVRLVVHRVLQELDHGVFIKELVEQLAEVAPDDVDLVDAGFQAGVDQAVDDAGAMDADKGLRRIEGYGHEARPKAGRDEHGPLGPIGLQCVYAGIRDRAVGHEAKLCELLHRAVYGAKAVPCRLFQVPLRQWGLGCRQCFQQVELLSGQVHVHFFLSLFRFLLSVAVVWNGFGAFSM